MPSYSQIRLAISALLLTASASSLHSQVSAPTGLTADSGGFHFDRKPLQIISGEMHYARIPRAYWRDRLRKARAMGLNTISTYVFWNLHEPKPGVFDFSGQNDVAEFVREAGQEGLHVILRPGPYVCAEWDLGGYPAWLLADSLMVLRSNEARFTTPAAKWLERLGKELSPLLTNKGGPIMAVQVENEYGSFDKDKAYLAWQLAAVKHAGFGGALLYTADGDVQLPNGTLAELPAVVNFGVGEADSAFARLARFRPRGALMSGEYWAGWFDQWGQKHQTTNVARQRNELDWMLSHGYSVNLYMFHGGTTFGFMNGANIDGKTYHPQTTSYDYDAALDESGRPTLKYTAFRDVIARYSKTPLPDVPKTAPPITVPEFPMLDYAPLFDNLPTPIHSERVRGMESLGQSYGYMLYRTVIPAATSPSGPSRRAMLAVHDVRDYAVIYINGFWSTTLDRRLNRDSVEIEIPNDATKLDIIVENGGRVNFRKDLRTERKGITGSVTFAGKQLAGWDIFSLPMSSVPKPNFKTMAQTKKTNANADVKLLNIAGYYRGSFSLAHVGDTFLVTLGWGKGTVWVNGHHLGRFWAVGPQQSLYVPSGWLKLGRNEVVLFDLDTSARETLSGSPRPYIE
ncbi:MAG: beta-galactosidase family protein [Gemmatimonadaceae bacterium]